MEIRGKREREGTYLPDCGSDAVVLATDGGRARLGRDQPDVVAGTKLAKAQEQSVDHREGADVFCGREILVAAGHDVSEGGLKDETYDKTPFRPDDVGEEGTEESTGDVLRGLATGPCLELGGGGIQIG